MDRIHATTVLDGSTTLYNCSFKMFSVVSNTAMFLHMKTKWNTVSGTAEQVDTTCA